MQDIVLNEKEVKEDIKKHALVTVHEIGFGSADMLYTLYLDKDTFGMIDTLKENSVALKVSSRRNVVMDPEVFEESVIDTVFKEYVEHIVKNSNTRITILA